MEVLFFPPSEGESGALEAHELRQVYAYPTSLHSPYVRVNMIMSLNGSGTVDGLSGGLGSDADLKIYDMLRSLADVVLVGAATVRAEQYNGIYLPDDIRVERRNKGMEEVPPLAIVSRRGDLDSSLPIFTDTLVSPIIFVGSLANPSNIRRLVDIGAKVIVAGENWPEIPAILAELSRRGMNHVLCEGGRTLFNRMLTAKAVDEFCLTLSPKLVEHAAPAELMNSNSEGCAMELRSLLVEADFLFARYVRTPTPPQLPR